MSLDALVHALVQVLVYALVDVTGETGQARAAKTVQETKLNCLSYCASRKSKQES